MRVSLLEWMSLLRVAAEVDVTAESVFAGVDVTPEGVLTEASVATKGVLLEVSRLGMSAEVDVTPRRAAY